MLGKSELLSLTWKEADFDRRLIPVRAASAKNGESRSVSMNAVLHRTLTAVRIMQSSGLVFRKKDGSPYQNFPTAFERAIKCAELPDCTLHDLRDTFASRLLMQDVDLSTVKVCCNSLILLPCRGGVTWQTQGT